MTELAFTVWEFVRVMVRLEAAVSHAPTGPHAALLSTWQEAWSELDAELVRLGETDPEAMQALMLDHEVRIGLPEELRPALLRTLQEVVGEMRSAMAAADPDLRAALAAEAEALEALRLRLPPAAR